MKMASIIKCLDLLKRIKTSVELDDSWPELVKEIDDTVRQLEEELSKLESDPQRSRSMLDNTLSNALRIISILLDVWVD